MKHLLATIFRTLYSWSWIWCFASHKIKMMRLKAVIKRKELNVSLRCWNACGWLNWALLLIYFYKSIMIANESEVERPWRWVINFFFLLVLRGATPGSPWLQVVSVMWLAVQSFPGPAFCTPWVMSTRAGFGDTNFELFTSTDVTKTCRSKTVLIFICYECLGAVQSADLHGAGSSVPGPGWARPTRCRCNAGSQRGNQETQSPNSWLIQTKRQRKL